MREKPVKTVVVAETDYYKILLKIFNPPRKREKDINKHDRDTSSSLELRKVSTTGEDIGCVERILIQDSSLYGRKNPAIEGLLKNFFSQQAVSMPKQKDSQQNDLIAGVVKLAREMYRLESCMQRKIAYYNEIIPALQAEAQAANPDKSSQAAVATAVD